MPDDQYTTRLDSPISSDRGSHLASDLRNYDSRVAIKEVVVEHISSSQFADRIKKTTLELLESTETYKKISDKVQVQIDTTLSSRGLRNRNFIVPSIIAAFGVLVAVAAVIVTILNP